MIGSLDSYNCAQRITCSSVDSIIIENLGTELHID